MTSSTRDGDTVRPILRRAAVNEMYVPYLDSDPTAYRKNFFDWGEYGAGPLTASLELGCDCLGEIRYFDAHFLDGYGEAKTITNGVCLHEEDASILWKHVNTRTGEADVRRSRRLVISFFATVANYDYGFYWSLNQDGAIELEVKLTGILSVSGIGDGLMPPYGRMVSPNVQAPTHQHYFAVRLDTEVDGPSNRLVEVHAEIEEDEALNPHGNAVKMVSETIASEKDAGRMVDGSRAVHWRVENTERTNRFGESTAFRLTLPHTTRLFAKPGSTVARKAPFVAKHLWASAYDPAERFIAGDYPNQAPLGEEGITAWQEADRPLDGAQLVLWRSSACTTTRSRRSGPSCRCTVSRCASSRMASSLATLRSICPLRGGRVPPRTPRRRAPRPRARGAPPRRALTMPEVLHAGALGASAVGACCLALDSRRPRVREALLALVMLAAMVDLAAGLRLIPVVVWSAATLVLSLALAVRRRASAEPPERLRARVHASLGGVLMAALMLAMGGLHGGSGHHSGSPAVFASVLVVAAVTYAVASVPWHGRVSIVGRIQYACMGASVLLLALGVLG